MGLTVTIMYTLRPIFPTLDETTVSTCMYKMRKITLHTEVGECIKSETVPPPAVDDKEIEELEKRWTMITSRLEQLKCDISEMECVPTPVATSPTEIMKPEEFEFLTRNPTLATPTPSGGNYIFPKTVTEEQESYVKGFEVALKNLQHQEIPNQIITGS